MNFCNHKPEFKFKSMFMRLPQFTCRVCGEKLEMTKPFQIATRIMNGILLAALFLVALSTGKGNTAGAADWNQMAVDIGIMIGIAALYFLLHLLLFRFAAYETIASPEQKSPVEPKSAGTEPQSPAYTAEQLEIMEMYAAAERQNQVSTGNDKETLEQVIPKVEAPALDTCDHIPAKNWKNYVPGKFDFICEKCGKPISIQPDIKKKVNILLLVVSFLILMPSFLDFSVAFWKFGLLSLLVVVISIAIQFFFLKRSHFILWNPKERKP